MTASDTATAYFYYPSTVTGSNADNLQLLYFDGANRDPVLSSGGAVPTKEGEAIRRAGSACRNPSTSSGKTGRWFSISRRVFCPDCGRGLHGDT